MDEQRDRLKKELRFLEDSLEAGIISEEEFQKGKRRVTRKLGEIGEEVPGVSADDREDQIIIESTKETRDITEEAKEDESEGRILEQRKEPQFTEEELTGDEKSEETFESSEAEDLEKQLARKEKQLLDEKKKGKKLEKEFEKELSKKDKEIENLKKGRKNGKKGNDLWKISTAVLLIALIAVILFNIYSDENIEDEIVVEEEAVVLDVEEIVEPECIDDAGCKEEGKIGVCINESCVFKDPVVVGLTIINDENCSSCDIEDVMIIIKNLFPGIVEDEVDYNTEEGKKMYSDLGVGLLPAYIFDKNIENTYTWETNARMRNSFTEVGEVYFLNQESSGASYTPE